jgi:zinc finger SWIM domain-containing protein 3
MDGQGAGKEEGEEYHLVVSKTFRSEDEGYEFYNEYAKVKGFSIRNEEVKYLPGTRARFRRFYTCFKQRILLILLNLIGTHSAVK